METLTMNKKERVRLDIMTRVRRKEIKLIKAAELMELCYRQTKRVWRRYDTQGDKGLVHKGRGRVSPRAKDKAWREKVLARVEEEYSDFGPTLAAEYLEKEKLVVDQETLRRWMLEKGIWKRLRKRKQHRQWRERKECCGELVQMDGSPHDWFEGRRALATLMVMIDDATSRTYARFFEEETTVAAFESFGRYAKRYGLPRALYVDRDSIYKIAREATVAEQIEQERPLTQFGRAMKTLGVKIVLANSPQAKGRVERENGVLQDRLVKAMRLEGINDLEGANEFLEKTFLPELNKRFAVGAANEADLHRAIPKDIKLEEVLCIQEDRVLAKDWTVRWEGRWFQVKRENDPLPRSGSRLMVRELATGKLQLVYRGEELRYRELPGRPERKTLPKPKQCNGAGSTWKPAGQHPWRRYAAAGARRGLAPAQLPSNNNKNNNNNNKNGSSQKRGHFNRVKKGDISKEF